MDEELYIWIVRWQDFQHYRPKRDRGPAWIKTYCGQLDDERYLNLTDRQRALLHDLRMMFAVMRGRIPLDDRSTTGRRPSDDRSSIAARRRQRTLGSDIVALNHAGLIDIISRETLDQRLEKLYNGSRAEVEVEKETTPTSNVPPLHTDDEHNFQPIGHIIPHALAKTMEGGK